MVLYDCQHIALRQAIVHGDVLKTKIGCAGPAAGGQLGEQNQRKNQAGKIIF
ncbi:MAG: hypothetical protein NTW95_00750 [Candidatus Aminicenantes bacterium]|nr:hypothetical protein [Candidatus Aminicenantes bacterium]